MKSKQPRTQARPRAFLGRFPLGPKSPALSRLQRLVPKDVKEVPDKFGDFYSCAA